MASPKLPSTLEITQVEPIEPQSPERDAKWWRVCLDDGKLQGVVEVYMTNADAADMSAQKSVRDWIAEQVAAEVRDVPGVNSQLRVLRQKSPLRLRWST